MGWLIECDGVGPSGLFVDLILFLNVDAIRKNMLVFMCVLKFVG